MPNGIRALREGAFEVEYTQFTPYMLAAEVLVLGTLLFAWYKRHPNRYLSHSFRANGNPRPGKDVEKSPVALSPEALNIPIPWGWPNYQNQRGRRGEKPSLSDAMRNFTDCLIREKQLVVPNRIDPRHAGSIRALLEDRYRPVRRYGDGALDANGVDQNVVVGTVVKLVTNHYGRIVPIRTLKPSSEAMPGADLIFAAPDREIRRPWGW